MLAGGKQATERVRWARRVPDRKTEQLERRSKEQEEQEEDERMRG